MVLEQTADGQGVPAKALEILDAMRWLDRVGYHTWRICNYLGGGGQDGVSAGGLKFTWNRGGLGRVCPGPKRDRERGW